MIIIELLTEQTHRYNELRRSISTIHNTEDKLFLHSQLYMYICMEQTSHAEC